MINRGSRMRKTMVIVDPALDDGRDEELRNPAVAAAYASHGGDVCQANLVAAHRQVGIYVGRILKGAGATDHAMRRAASSVGEVVRWVEAVCRFRSANRSRRRGDLPSGIRAGKQVILATSGVDAEPICP